MADRKRNKFKEEKPSPGTRAMTNCVEGGRTKAVGARHICVRLYPWNGELLCVGISNNFDFTHY